MIVNDKSRKIVRVSGAGLLLALLIVWGSARDFPMFRGGVDRTGKSSTNPSQGVGAPARYDNPGRSFLRWWDPGIADRTIIDNWRLSNGTPPYPVPPNATANPVAGWIFPATSGVEWASAYYETLSDPIDANWAPYRYAFTTASESFERPDLAANPAQLRSFEWNLGGMSAGSEVALSVSIPIGRTFDPGRGRALSSAPFYVYRIDNVVDPLDPGNPAANSVIAIVDAENFAGGWTPLNTPNPTGTSNLYTVKADLPAQVKVTLLNTVPRLADGTLRGDPNNTLVYADALMAINQDEGNSGTYIASPIVSTIQNNPGVPAADFERFKVRTVAARNEPLTVQVGTGSQAQVRNYELGVVTSYKHNGVTQSGAAPIVGDVRRNVLWSWPIQRPIEGTTAAAQAYAEAKRGWIVEPAPAANGWASYPLPRGDSSIIVDDKSSYGTVSVAPANWTEVTTGVNFFGETAQEGIVDAQPRTVTFELNPNAEAGDYDVWVFFAPGPLPDLPPRYDANAVIHEIWEGTTRVAEVPVDQGNLSQRRFTGWVRLTLNNRMRFRHTKAAPLKVVVTNRAGNGTLVYADAARFVRPANTKITSTPVHANVNLTLTGAPRDVVIVANESGRIYCTDAYGNFDAVNRRTRTFWAYPTDPLLTRGVVDPNQLTGRDGRGVPGAVGKEIGAIAEAPLGFDLSSALVQRVDDSGTPRDLLFIASKDGRVRCIDAAGRADGSAERVWSWPDDWPSPSRIKGKTDAIISSVCYVDIPSEPTIIVATQDGHIYALDALPPAGPLRTQRITRVKWQYPAAGQLGPITMTPAVMRVPGSGPRIFFGALSTVTSRNTFYSLNALNGNVAWTYDGFADNIRLGTFNTSSPTAVPASYFDAGGMPNAVFFVNNDVNQIAPPSSRGPTVFALDANDTAVGSRVLWSSNEIESACNASPIFTYQDVFVDDSGSFVYSTAAGFAAGKPTLVVPTIDGRLVSLFADQADTNRIGGRTAWEYFMEGPPLLASPSVGGRRELPPDPAETEYNADPGRYCFLYAADSLGFLYAFSWNPNEGDNRQQITPGVPPGQSSIVPNDPAGADLEALVSTAQVRVIPPGKYDELVGEAARSGPAQAIVDANVRAAELQAVDRDGDPDPFEFGESLCLLISPMPGTPNLTGVSMQIQVNSASGASPQRVVQGQGNGRTYNVTGGAGTAFVGLYKIDLSPTGGNGLLPGLNQVQIRVVASGPRSRGGVSRPIPNGFRTFTLNNPIGVATFPIRLVTEEIGGYTGSWSTVLDNNAAKYNGNRVDPGGATRFLRSGIGPDVNAPGEYVSHGQNGRSLIYVADRSLMVLLRDGGLSNVRTSLNDLRYRIESPTQLPEEKVFKPLNPGVTNAYPLYEELPNNVPNVSLDYPDIRREAIQVVKEPNGNAENPVFNGVKLVPPTGITDAIRDAYRTTQAGFRDGLTGRTIKNTEFEAVLNVPRYQPPNGPFLRDPRPDTDPNPNPYEAGYHNYSTQKNFIYVDSNVVGRQPTQQPYREFEYQANVGIDEDLRLGTPMIDLGSITPGTGYIDGALVGAAIAPGIPWFAGTDFDPRAFGGRHPVVQTRFFNFEALNEGNVNLLNVRMAKGTYNRLGAVISPLPIFSSTLHELASMDASTHVHSSLDPRFTPDPFAGLGVNEGGWAIIQKPRPGDPGPTRLATNPPRRANPNTGATALGTNPNIESSIFPAGQGPKVAVAVPYGTPVGKYVANLRLIEGLGDRNLGTPQLPLLGNDRANPLNGDPEFEPSTNPGLILQYTVRENQLTAEYQLDTGYTEASAIRLENLSAIALFDRNFSWGNTSPTALRTSGGSLITAFSSNRLNVAGAPFWDPRAKANTDMGAPEKWRIYFTTLGGDTPLPAPFEPDPFAGGFGSNPLRDLNRFGAASATSWFAKDLGPFPDTTVTPLTTLFSLPLNQIQGDGRFGSPAFPAFGVFDPLDNPFDPGSGNVRSPLGVVYMAFVGECNWLKGRAAGVDPASDSVIRSQVFLVPMTVNPDGTFTAGTIEPLLADTEARKGKPSVVQTFEGGVNRTTVFYAATSSGQTKINWANFDETNGWTQVGALPLPSSFESVGSPSAVLHRYRDANPVVGDETNVRFYLTFPAKTRHRSNTEIYLARLIGTTQGQMFEKPRFETSLRVDKLLYDAAGGYFHAPGVDWVLSSLVDPNKLNIFAYRPGGVEVSILRPGTGKLDNEGRILSYESTLGGRVVIDLSAGTVRLTSAVLRQSEQIFARYEPRFLRVSGDQSGGEASGQLADYRNAFIGYDDRLIGELSYWVDNTNTPVTNPNAGIRNDRYVMSYTRTTPTVGGGSRPFIRSFRYGIKLPTAVLTGPGGVVITPFTVIPNGPAPRTPWYYQVDPIKGVIYFSAEAENLAFNIVYQGADDTGQNLGGIVLEEQRVTLLPETNESAVPLEPQRGQGMNDTGLFLAIDPMNSQFNSASYRRPGLWWGFWTSNRTGNPEIFFQTLAPKFTPRAP